MAANVESERSISDDINAATRSLHTALNRLITSRLPLALPPHAADPTLYTTGLLHFAHIFLTFESLWTDLSSSTAKPTPTSPLLSYLLVNPYDSPEPFTSENPAPHISPDVLTFLRTLRPGGLARSRRIKKDLKTLLNLTGTDYDVLMSQYPSPRVAEFCTHIRSSVSRKPHVLVAYAWCFYMAVFSGGRWIRAQLEGAGGEFWDSGPGEMKGGTGLKGRGLAVWNFEGVEDGEDIKGLFKEKLKDGEGLWTEEMRGEIVEEAREVFRWCARLVGELDEVVGGEEKKKMEANEGRVKKEMGEEASSSVEEDGVGSATVATQSASRSWLLKPQVSGAVVALGCLAYVALVKMDLRFAW
ncbi:heme oxygenase-like protein [Sporormia fimetaria CBS 119925]|uniref:Heme oxygenase-like protein n=1 Tax=Sporormia fimetaria CBS 119925 TaxID=1340428 RepID=A0A6A6UZ62_9PLEO|nr:heme oxygenase-like protein [Sporormia fimetaria CBS 119925]